MARAPRAAPVNAEMVLGAVAPAPIGYVEFCQREPSDCPTNTTSGFGAGYWTLAFKQTRSTPHNTVRAPASLRSFFGWRRSARRAKATVVEPASPALAGYRRVPLSNSVWTELNRVNRDVNAHIQPTPDDLAFGVEDFWALPSRDAWSRGDCEDYVLEKRHRLLERGFPQESLSVALVRTPWGENHAVLLVETAAGVYVMDSLTSWIQPWTKIDYQWVVRQSPVDPSVWVEIGNRAAG
jgi:predicted transglutaminase-like cysteine proteinase